MGKLELEDPSTNLHPTKGLPPEALPPQPPREAGGKVIAVGLMSSALRYRSFANGKEPRRRWRTTAPLFVALACPHGFPQLWSSLREWWRAQRGGFAGSAPCWRGSSWSLCGSRRPSNGGGAMATWSTTGSVGKRTSGTECVASAGLGLLPLLRAPVDPILSEMMASLQSSRTVSFMDVGSGKGRTLLMAFKCG